MRRGHTPFGYRIENGCAVVNETEAGQIRTVYAGYLSGLGYIEAAKRAGLTMTHSSIKRMLQNRYYLGDDFYPAIVDKETFDAAEKERLNRAERLGRLFDKESVVGQRSIPVKFVIGDLIEVYEDPFEQAAYVYSMIGSEGQ